MSHDEEYANAKMKLLWSSTREQDSVLLTPDECRALLKELPDPEEGTVDIKRREYEYDSEKPRSTGVPGMRDDDPPDMSRFQMIDKPLPGLASEPPRTLAINPGDPSCSHIWTGVTGRPDWDAGQCTLCGAIQTNAMIARRRYAHDQEHGKSYEWQGDPGDEN